jgi:hypothetical protein
LKFPRRNPTGKLYQFHVHFGRDGRPVFSPLVSICGAPRFPIGKPSAKRVKALPYRETAQHSFYGDVYSNGARTPFLSIRGGEAIRGGIGFDGLTTGTPDRQKRFCLSQNWEIILAFPAAWFHLAPCPLPWYAPFPCRETQASSSLFNHGLSRNLSD